ncbi:tyrosine-protein kinase shark-like protein, partial [Dinothrombium tinctorium]
RSLIEAGARVNTRDSQGMTALHYATIANNRTAVQLLLNEGNASPQVRNNSGWVALHFAAHFGFDEIIVQLLKYGCALNPRTATDETPFDLALRQKHAKCVRLLESFENRALINCPLKHEWFHEYLIDRKSSEQLLQNQGLKDGLFLIRYSKQKQHVLVLVHNERVYHFLIQRKRQFYSINDGPYFKTLNELVSYYHRFADGLPATLQIPALRSLNSAELACQQQQMRWISAEDVQIGLLIGYGKYGRVHHGVWRKKAFLTIEIAVKVLHDSDNHDCRRANEEDVLLREMQALRTLRNPHIVKIYGFCKGSPLMILEEMMPYGSLLDYVRSNAEELNVEYHLKLWLAQIALGMRYLERNRFVHGDLALRNVLLASETRAKISEFGTARLVGSNQLDISNACVQSPIVQWYAPECIKFARFTNASDVWSFGVTLWELYSFGEQPFAYEHCSGLRVLRFIESGERLERPEQCARKIYALMLMCWSYECDQRPTFEQICQLISEESFFENIRGEIET